MTPTADEIFRWPVRVYYEDTDAAGVVYYATPEISGTGAHGMAGVAGIHADRSRT